MSVKWKYCITLLVAVILGFQIYHRSGLPPYGHPINELSDNYWGVIIDIAHRWRSFDFTLWNMGLGGGISLFTSGEYPLLNPTNFLAWFLNDDVFFKVKLIEPYVLGCFFMMILLWDVFKTRWYVACFGGLAYIGLTLAKATTMAESPYFLYGCGLFPAMVFAAMKLLQKHIYLAAAGVGALLALQFLGEGVTQVPQLIIWWTIFFTIYLLREGFSLTTIKRLSVTILILVGTAVGLSAVQMVPTAHFFHYESARIAGHYSINNSPIFNMSLGGDVPLARHFWEAFMQAGPIRTKGILVLVLVCLALSCVRFGRIFAKAQYKGFIYQAWTATIIYFLIPPTAGLMAQVLPFLKETFNFMTFFTFSYGLHILDFCMILSICLILNDDQLSFPIKKIGWIRGGSGIVFLILGLSVSLAPCLIFLSPGFAKWFVLKPYFMISSLNDGSRFLFKSLALIFLIVVRPVQKIFALALMILLIGMGFMMSLDCFKWYDKGSRTHPEDYQLTSPEHEYYAQAQGKYIFPYLSGEPQWIIHNYNLLYGVHGTCGDMALSPLRINKFRFYYNNRFREDIATMPFAGNDAKFILIDRPLWSLTTYFPIDFTMINKGAPLPWKGFVKAVSGDQYDVYQRADPTPQVYFADRLQIVPLPELILKFDEPRSDVVYVASEDARALGLSPVDLASGTSQARYRDYHVQKEDHLTFEVMADQDIFVIVPQRFEAGWEVKVDGRKVQVFPADYLFIGFRIPGGDHAIELRYVPTGFWAGAMMTIVSIIGVMCLLRRFY